MFRLVIVLERRVKHFVLQGDRDAFFGGSSDFVFGAGSSSVLYQHSSVDSFGESGQLRGLGSFDEAADRHVIYLIATTNCM